MHADERWSVTVDADGETVVATFRGYLEGEDGERSAEAFAAHLRDRRRPVVWNVVRMTGYARGAREAWERTLRPVRGNIARITLIGGGILTRVGANILAIALGVPLIYHALPEGRDAES
jgi:hypothetical protein